MGLLSSGFLAAKIHRHDATHAMTYICLPYKAHQPQTFSERDPAALYNVPGFGRQLDLAVSFVTIARFIMENTKCFVFIHSSYDWVFFLPFMSFATMLCTNRGCRTYCPQRCRTNTRQTMERLWAGKLTVSVKYCPECCIKPWLSPTLVRPCVLYCLPGWRRHEAAGLTPAWKQLFFKDWEVDSVKYDRRQWTVGVYSLTMLIKMSLYLSGHLLLLVS